MEHLKAGSRATRFGPKEYFTGTVLQDPIDRGARARARARQPRHLSAGGADELAHAPAAARRSTCCRVSVASRPRAEGGRDPGRRHHLDSAGREALARCRSRYRDVPSSPSRKQTAPPLSIGSSRSPTGITARSPEPAGSGTAAAESLLVVSILSVEKTRGGRPVSRVLSPACGEGMAIHLGPRSPAASCGPPGKRAGDGPGRRSPRFPYLTLLPVGLAVPPPLPGARWALTPPFHLCRAGARQTVLCGAFPGVAPAGRYPAPCLREARTFLPARPLARPGGAAIRPSARVS